MLRIRREQMQQLEAAMIAAFERRTLNHIKERFPKRHAALGEPVLAEVIRLGIERARSYGFDAEREVCCYIDLMLLLGSHFDTDPLLPWAAATLKAEAIEDPASRIQQLNDEAREHLEQTAGPKGEFLDDALRALDAHPIPETWQPKSGTLERSIAEELRAIWPQKWAALGEAKIGELVHRSAEAAQGYGIRHGRGALIYAELVFMLGSGFDKDPQFPWAAAALTDKSIRNPVERADRLYSGANACLKKLLR